MWNKDYNKCVKCQDTKYKYMAKGLCSQCYLEEYRNNPKNIEKARQAKRKWYIKNITPEAQKVKREQDNFDGNREAVLKRDEYKCQSRECSESRLSQLTVHHVDGNGRGSSGTNNDMSNLLTLCRSCHARLHHTANRWAKNYDECIICEKTDKRHNAKGFCTACYWKYR